MDSSALIAVILEEPGYDAILASLVNAERSRMSSGNWLETTLRIDNFGAEMSGRLDQLIVELSIEIVAFTPAMAIIARNAHRRFGRGNHQARLNFGDCIAYGLSMHEDQPLLFKGNDFPHTDITPALA